MEVQGSLLDAPCSVGQGATVGRLAPTRRFLPSGAWIDHQPDWVVGSDGLFNDLVRAVDWRADRRPMYDRVVEVPRLTRYYGASEAMPHPMVSRLRDALSDHYAAELGERFVTVGMCLYRDGRDSVAWHGDREGRSSTDDTMVAIVSLGTPRVLALRRRDGGPTLHRFALGHGDLLVMGGSCQRTWDHAIPKTSAPVCPRISLQFRTRGVR